MFNRKSAGLLSAMMAAGVLASGAAVAQSPVVGWGYVSIDHTDKFGPFEDFRCAVQVLGRTDSSGDLISITGVVPLADGQGEIPTGCALVSVDQLPWTTTVTGGSVRIDGISFRAGMLPGCGTDSGGAPDPGSYLVTSWIPAGPSSDVARVVMSGDTIFDSATGDCEITGELILR